MKKLIVQAILSVTALHLSTEHETDADQLAKITQDAAVEMTEAQENWKSNWKVEDSESPRETSEVRGLARSRPL